MGSTLSRKCLKTKEELKMAEPIKPKENETPEPEVEPEPAPKPVPPVVPGKSSDVTEEFLKEMKAKFDEWEEFKTENGWLPKSKRSPAPEPKKETGCAIGPLCAEHHHG
jgi:hypothetical protein